MNKHKMKIFITLFLISFSLSVFSQSNKALKQNTWKSIEPKNSPKDLVKYAKYLKESYNWEFPIQEEFLSIGFHAAQYHKNDTLSYDFAYELGYLYLSEDSLFNALYTFYDALFFTTTTSQASDIYNLIGYTYSSLEDYQSSLDYYFK